MSQEPKTDRTLRITPRDLEAIRRQAREGYPNECCGLLTGRAGEHREVQAVHPAENIADPPRDRYHLNPVDHFRVQKSCRGQPWEIIGFYHSHPDYPSRPSQTDVGQAWADYSYLIVSVVGGEVERITSWFFNGQLQRFEEERIIVEEVGPDR